MPAVSRIALVVAPVLLLVGAVNRTGAPSHSTGAPGESTCVVCHTGNPVNTSTGAVSIGAPDSYVPGETVSISVRVERAAASRFGFQLTAKNSNDQFIGAFDASGPGVRFALGSQDEHVTHNPAQDSDGSFTWTIPWTAPAEGGGDVIFYAAGNGANGDFTNQGDFIFTSSRAMTEGTATGLEANSEVPFALELGTAFPNPIRTGDLVIPYSARTSTPVGLTLSDMAGRSVSARITRQAERFIVDTDGLAPGIYLARFSDGRSVHSKQFTVLR